MQWQMIVFYIYLWSRQRPGGGRPYDDLQCHQLMFIFIFLISILTMHSNLSLNFDSIAYIMIT